MTRSRPCHRKRQGIPPQGRNPFVVDYDPTPPLPSEYREGNARAVRPRDAATLVIVRNDASPKILLGKRAASHRFMPNKFVFPGGKLDRADQRIAVEESLHPAVLDRLRKNVPKRVTENTLRGLALAAIRETFEETGLVVGRATRHPSASRDPVWQQYFSNGVTPPLGDLDFIARAITPTYRTRRFDTRFFMVEENCLYNDPEALQDASGELLELCWVTPEEARNLDLPGVTRWVIDRVEERLATQRHVRQRQSAPFIRFINGDTRVIAL